MASIKSQIFDRRFVLKGAGATIALPLMESLSAEKSGSFSKGFQEITKVSPVMAGAAAGKPLSDVGIPKRLGFICMGYGCNYEKWVPRKVGKDFELPTNTKPFEPVKDDISFLQGLHVGGRPGNPHGGTYTFLMGEAKFVGAASVDIAAASFIGQDTRFDNIAIGRIGRADGHGALPSRNPNGSPASAFRDGDKLYTALFGNGQSKNEVVARLRREQSSIDAVLQDAKKLAKRVGREDRERIEEYFDSIRNIEKRLVKAQGYADRPLPEAPFAKAQIRKLKQKAVFDMLVVAMQSDSSRVLTYSLATADVVGRHPHRISHKPGGDDSNRRDIAFSKNVSYFFKRLKDTKEGDGNSLLYHSLIAYGTTLKKSHSFGSPPFILAGNGGGSIKQGQNLKLKGMGTVNVWSSMLKHIGAEKTAFRKAKSKVIKPLGFS